MYDILYNIHLLEEEKYMEMFIIYYTSTRERKVTSVRTNYEWENVSVANYLRSKDTTLNLRSFSNLQAFKPSAGLNQSINFSPYTPGVSQNNEKYVFFLIINLIVYF